MKHTIKDANDLLALIKKEISPNAILIGSLGDGRESDHDIDILLLNKRRTKKLKERLTNLFESSDFEETDWNGWYFSNTIFGDVDIFFTNKDFDR